MSVVDASAILALLQGEAGADVVAGILAGAALSAVNLSESAAKLEERGVPAGVAREVLLGLDLDIVPFDTELALLAAGLRERTRHHGLSLADRACLALARQRGEPVYTADRAWARLDLDIEVRLIRGDLG